MAGDADFDKVSLLLHCDGANGSTTFADNSPDPSSITAVGGAAIGTANAKYGTGAVSANGGRLTVPNADKLNLSIGDWTIELWFWLNSSGTQARLIDKEIGNGSYPWAINCGQLTSGKIDFRSFNTGGSLLPDLVGTTTVAAQQWNHVAVCRAGDTYRLFLNGVQEAIATRSDALRVSTDPVNIGNNGANSTYGGLLIDEVRITKGVARYTANFTPPTESFPDVGATAYAISGTVTGSTGSPAARAIRAQREDTGAYVGGVISNATTGAYTIPTEYPGEHTVVAYPVTGENLPALVHHGVIPI